VDSIRGAIELRQRIAEQVDPAAEPDESKRAHVPADALPVFHWLGVSPPPTYGDER
jgi:hypothetical protein